MPQPCKAAGQTEKTSDLFAFLGASFRPLPTDGQRSHLRASGKGHAFSGRPLREGVICDNGRGERIARSSDDRQQPRQNNGALYDESGETFDGSEPFSCFVLSHAGIDVRYRPPPHRGGRRTHPTARATIHLGGKAHLRLGHPRSAQNTMAAVFEQHEVKVGCSVPQIRVSGRPLTLTRHSSS